MAIDTSMYNALMQRPKSAMEYANEFANADYVREQRGFERQRNALAMQIAQDAAAERTRQRGEQDGVRNALAGLGADTAPERQIGALRALGTQTALTQADALEKGWIERRKGAAAAGKDEQEITGKRLSMFRDFLPQVATPEDAIRWTRAQYADPVVGPVVSGLGTFEQAVAGIPQDPAKFGEWRNATAIGLEKYLAHMQQERQIAEAGRHNRAGEAISVRGQDVGAATARRGQDIGAATTRRGQDLETSRAAGQVTYQTDANGNLVALPTRIAPGQSASAVPALDASGKPIPGKDGGLNDSQSKALLFGSRMREADKNLSTLADAGTYRPGVIHSAADSVPLVGSALGAATNWTQSPEQQQVEQAQRDFINATLRRESGAAISPSEFENARKQYFVQIGDSEEVKAQKARNRRLATEGMLIEVPQGKRDAISKGGQQPAPRSAGVIDFGSLK